MVSNLLKTYFIVKFISFFNTKSLQRSPVSIKISALVGVIQRVGCTCKVVAPMREPGIRGLQFFVLSAIFILVFDQCVWGLTKAEEEQIRKEAGNFKYNTVTPKEGLLFRVPEDMPVETRNGIQAPIPFDEYMYGKFKQMDERLKSIETKLDNIEKLITSPKEEKRSTLASR